MEKKPPPTHTAWCQFRERGLFREWYRRGDAWIEKAPDGQITGKVFLASHGCRGDDGYVYFFPIGTPPPPPPEPKRPSAVETDSD